MMRQRRVLVVETDQYRLRAAVVRVEGERIVIEQVVGSTATKFEESLGQAVGALTVTAPKRAILVTSEAAPAIVELPVGPSKPLSSVQMQEMVRWELEPFLAQQAGNRSIGSVLVRRGYLTAEQARLVAREQQSRWPQQVPGLQAGASRKLLFGQVAKELGLVTADQVSESLAFQESLIDQSQDGAYACGWVSHDEWTTPNGHRWLVCGISRSARERYVEGFKRQGLSLSAIYPLVGCGAAALNGEAAGASCSVIELQAGVSACTDLRNGLLEDFRVSYGDQQSITDSCLQLIDRENAQAVWMAGRLLDDATPCDELELVLGVPVRRVPEPVLNERVGAEVGDLTPMVGAARHALGLSDPQRGVFVPANDPPLPMRQRIGVWWAGAAGLMVVAILAAECVQAYRIGKIQARRDEVVKQLEKVESLAEQAQQASQQIKKLQGEIDRHQQELRAAKEMVSWLDFNIVHRSRFRVAMLDAVTGVIPPQVAIDSIREGPDHAIEIEAWALVESAVHEFARGLMESLKSWGVKVSGPSVWLKSGRLDLGGYGVRLRLELLEGQTKGHGG